jgi:class 3 adenylate cyclase
MASEVEALVRHLRQNPNDMRRPANELARSFGLHESLVADVLRWLDGSAMPNAETKPVRVLKKKEPKQSFFADAHDFFDRNALVLLVVSAIFAKTVHLVTGLIPATILAAGTIKAINYIVSLIAFGFCIVCFFARGRIKFCLLGAALYGLITALGDIIDFKPSFSFEPLNAIPGLLLGFVVLVFGMIAAFAGGVWRYRVEAKRRANLTRQQMLERLFELRDRIALMGDASKMMGTLPDWRLAFQRDCWWYSFGFALVVGVVMVVLGYLLDPSGVALLGKAKDQLSAVTFGLLLFAVFDFVVWTVLGFFSGSPQRALVASTGSILGGLLASLLPIGPYGFHMLVTSGLQQWVLSSLMQLGLFSFGGAAALLEQHQRKLDLHAKNDTSVLLAEMLELEWKLRPQSHRVCVMVVDAAKSSIMKSQADPFEAEWTFREYQTFLSRISEANLGSVHAVAGDGAVVGFATSHEALAAAKQIQAEIGEFNHLVNRLSHPFRLRIGLHAGEIQGALDQVMYTEVIDIAAHVEAVCPLGGLAMTETVMNELGSGPFENLNQVVDGQNVFVWKPATFEV